MPAAAGVLQTCAQGLQNVPVQTSPTKQTDSAITTLHTFVNLVNVDVVVKDKDGRPIYGLKPSDFVLTENKVQQTIKNFEEHTSGEVGGGGAMPVLPAGVFTNYAPAPAKGPLNMLLFDKLNTGLPDQANLRLQMLKFINQAKLGTRMAVLDLGFQLRVLQGFTDDREVLREAIRDKNAPALAVLVPDKTGCIHSYVMLSTMHFLALYLGNLPGRKNLLWYSDSLPFNMFPDKDKNCPSAEEYRRAVDKLIANQVSIYPIGVSGWLGESADEMALETGGLSFRNPNALDEETAEAMEDGSSYYTLAYAPLDARWNNAYRNIEVTLANGQTAELSYRRGYYANDPNKPVKTAIFGRGQLPGKEPRPDAMHMAMMLGVPPASEISFATRVLPAGSAKESSLAAGNEGSKGLKGPYQRYGLHLAVDPRTLLFTESADGVRHGSLEFVAFVYDMSGNVVNSMGRTAKVDLKLAVYESTMRDGLPLELEVSVPAKGEYTLRIAVHDLNNDRVGAIEVPVSSVRNLAAAK